MSTPAPAPVRYVPNATGASTPAYQTVRETAKTMVAEGRSDEALDFALTALAAVLQKSRELELLLAKLRRAQAGKATERVDPEQMAPLFEELVAQLGSQPEALDPEAEARADAQLEAEIEAAREAQEARGEGEPKPPRAGARGTWRRRSTTSRSPRGIVRARGAALSRRGSART